MFETIEAKKVILKREDKAGVVFLTCDKMPSLFIAAVGDDTKIRGYIDQGIKCLFSSLDSEDISVYTNGSLAGPEINVSVEIKA